MLINLLFQSPETFFAIFTALIVAVTVHEFSHAAAAERLGDPTPRLQGRLTLNPLAHLDPIGTLFILFTGFGWGRPVQFDPYNLENPRRDAAVISFAGPLSNIAVASIASIIIRFGLSPFSPIAFLAPLLYFLIQLNVVLAIFNLIPIHPLDGGKILVGLLPPKDASKADLFMNKYGLIVLILLVFPILGGASPVSLFLSPVVRFLVNIYVPGSIPI